MEQILRMDFVRKGETIYLVTNRGDEFYLWDFKAWLKGYYDAYIPLSDYADGELEVIGNFYSNPNLLPKECEGYNGEPHITKLETIWTQTGGTDEVKDGS